LPLRGHRFIAYLFSEAFPKPEASILERCVQLIDANSRHCGIGVVTSNAILLQKRVSYLFERLPERHRASRVLSEQKTRGPRNSNNANGSKSASGPQPKLIVPGGHNVLRSMGPEGIRPARGLRDRYRITRPMIPTRQRRFG
jgi:hypothetical protein